LLVLAEGNQNLIYSHRAKACKWEV